MNQRDDLFQRNSLCLYYLFWRCSFTTSSLHNFRDGIGILFRASSQGEHFYYFSIRSDTSWGLQKDTPGSGTPTNVAGGRGGLTSEAIRPDLNTLFVVASDDQIYLYVNGVFLEQVHDKAYSQGEVGLVAGSGQDHSSQSEVVFSNMKIWLQPSLVS